MKTVCIYHSVDLDGWMSAAIVKHWFINNNNKHELPGYTIDNKIEGDIYNAEDNILNFIGYNYGQVIPDLSEYDNIIMCDISFPKETMLELANKYDVRFRWIDHHQPKINEVSKYLGENKAPTIDGLTTIEGRPKFAACELTWKYFFPDEEMPEIVRLLGRYDCFGHKNTDEEQKVLEFQYGARQYISNYEEAYDNLVQSISYTKENSNFSFTSPEEDILITGKPIYKYLCTEAKQVYKNGFEISFTVVNQILNVPELGLVDATTSIIYKFLCLNKERFNPINFGIDYYKDGYDGAACFWYDKGEWAFSLYNDNGKVDCSAIAKQYGGGGHKGASGFRLNNEEFLKLISNPNKLELV